ncbi:MAG: calcium/sodium antiporter [Chloroflexaceae bacterium]|nr:calcium/sodium antiporter [Chloroflexaceae bacterium]
MTLVTWLMLAGGLALLIVGAEALVRGASHLAALVGISPLVVGLTVVAFGTSSPELAVSVQSALAGQADIAVGNVIGSNIFNVLFILGICAVIVPLTVAQQLVRLDVPIMIGVSLLMWVLARDGTIGTFDGGLLFVGIVSYIIFGIYQSRKESAAVKDEYAQAFGEQPARPFTNTVIQIGLVVVGLALLVLGSRWLVDSAVVIARSLGLSELVIGLTIVAVGTSMPEVATSIIASIKGERDIAVGNVVGSNIFNVLAILGITSLITPVPVSATALAIDIPVMIAVAVACLPIFFTGMQIARWEGMIFLGSYITYTVYLILNATGSAALPTFVQVVLIALIPIVLVILASGGRALFSSAKRKA